MKILNSLGRSLSFNKRPANEVSIGDKFRQFLIFYAPVSLLISLAVSIFYETSSTLRNFRNFSSLKINELVGQTKLAEDTSRDLQATMETFGKRCAENIAVFLQKDPYLLNATEEKSNNQQDGLGKLAFLSSIDEIAITDERGVVIAAYPTDSVGSNFDHPPLNEFLPLIDNPTLAMAQKVRTSVSNPEAGMFLYAATGRRDAPGVVEVGIAAPRIHNLYKIGELNKFIIPSYDKHNPFAVFKDGTFVGGEEWLSEIPYEKIRNGGTIPVKHNGERFLVYLEKRGAYTYACSGGAGLLIKQNLIGLFIATLLNFVIFISLLFIGSYLIQRYIVSSVHKLNKSLMKITNGDLEARVDVRNSKEFSELSDGVNATVDALKNSMEEVKEKVQEELAFAQKIQAAALPDVEKRFSRENRFEIYATNRPMHLVGGDMYDFFNIDDHSVMFYVADVSGHGVGAALVMMKTMALVKNLVMSGNKLEDVVSITNKYLTEDNESMFVTGFFCIVDLTRGAMQYVNAGHNPPFLRRRGDSFKVTHPDVNLILGVSPNEKYAASELQLYPGDLLMLYTDGITEATSPNVDCFETSRALSVLNSVKETEAVKKIAETLFDAIARFTGTTEPSDDETALLFRLRKVE